MSLKNLTVFINHRVNSVTCVLVSFVVIRAVICYRVTFSKVPNVNLKTDFVWELWFMKLLFTRIDCELLSLHNRMDELHCSHSSENKMNFFFFGFLRVSTH